MHMPDPYHLTWMWTWPGMGQCLDLHADVTLQRKARPPFWDLPQTQHITNHGRSGSRATQLRLPLYDRAHSSKETRAYPRNATRRRASSFIVLGAVRGKFGLCRAVATLVSANFQINISAIPYWKRLWMDSFFLRSPPDEGQSEEHTDWGYRRQSCWVCVYIKWAFVFIVVVPISPVGCLVSGSLTPAINRVICSFTAQVVLCVCLHHPTFPGVKAGLI